MLKVHYPRVIISSTDNALRSFCYCMMDCGINDIYYTKSGVPAVYYSSVKFTFSDYSITMRDIVGSVPQRMERLINKGEIPNEILKEMTNKFLEFEKDGTIKTPLKFLTKQKDS